MYYLSLCLEYFKLNARKLWEFRISFFSGVIAQAISYGSEFLILWIMIDKFKSLNGWNSHEILFLYALSLLSYALAATFFFDFCTKLPSLIENGEFDEILTKPLNPFIYIIIKHINYGYISHVVVSITIIIYSLVNLHITLTVLKLLYLIMGILGATLIQAAALVITALPAFWIIQSGSIQFVFFYKIKSFTQYPISLYNKGIQVFLTVVFPYAFINFYPSQLLLNKNDFPILNASLKYLSPVIGAILIIIAYSLWNFALKNYSSSGT